jgi:hypothetical protein
MSWGWIILFLWLIMLSSKSREDVNIKRYLHKIMTCLQPLDSIPNVGNCAFIKILSSIVGSRQIQKAS